MKKMLVVFMIFSAALVYAQSTFENQYLGKWISYDVEGYQYTHEVIIEKGKAGIAVTCVEKNKNGKMEPFQITIPGYVNDYGMLITYNGNEVNTYIIDKNNDLISNIKLNFKKIVILKYRKE